MKTGWQTRRLGELCSFENGDRGENYPSKSVQTTSGVPFINAGHLSGDGIDFTGMNYIPRERFELLGNGKIRENDILFCLRGSLGKFASTGNVGEGAIASSLIIIRPNDGLLNSFLLAYLQSDICASMIHAFKNGAAQPNLSAASLKQFEIPLPPLAEQQRIVGILDEAFEGIAAAKENAETNLENARALFESELNAMFSTRGEGWTEKHLGDLADFKNGLNYSSSSNGQAVPVVGVGDFQRNYVVPVADLESVTIDGVLHESYQLREGDIVTVRSNGSKDLVGRCMLVPEMHGGISYSGFVIRIRPDKSAVYPRLLLHFMKASSTRRRLVGSGQGANISNINQGKLSALPLSLPPVDSQKRLADELDELRDETEHLEAIYRRKIAALNELKQSLLHEAFSGKL